MIGDWQDEWDLKRRGSDRSVNRHDTCRVAAYLNEAREADADLRVDFPRKHWPRSLRTRALELRKVMEVYGYRAK